MQRPVHSAGPGFLKVNSLSMPGFNLQLFGLTGKADMEVTTESLDWSSWNSITCYPRLPHCFLGLLTVGFLCEGAMRLSLETRPL